MAIENLGRYQIVAELGHGAMGVVYKATDPLLDRTVAIKTISLNLSSDELAEFEQRFYREAQSAGRLNHPNIVTVYDVGKTDDVAYMAMEFLRGEELRNLLDSGARLPLDRIVDIAAQVAEGLAFAHQHGVVHRDIKPTNIMILENGTAKITDFGIALIPSSSRTMPGVVLGSPKYMSPEQVVGHNLDGRSDIFSLGVVLYEMLTGIPPFSGENISAIMFRILNEMPVAPNALKPDIPEAFNFIIAKALAKHPDDRYQNAGKMAHDLRNHAGLEVPADIYPPSSEGRLRTLERRTTPRPVSDETTFLPAFSAAQPDFESKRDPVPQMPAPPRRNKKRIALMAVAAVIGTVVAASLLRNQESAPRPEAEKIALAPAPKAATGSMPGKAAPTALEATLALAITPWGEVFVDGESRGVAPPLKELKLSAGRHTVEIRNGNFKPYIETLDIKPDATRKIKHKFGSKPS